MNHNICVILVNLNNIQPSVCDKAKEEEGYLCLFVTFIVNILFIILQKGYFISISPLHK